MVQPFSHFKENTDLSLRHKKCESYLLLSSETSLGNGVRTFVYLLGLAYCFIGLSAITARFFKSMEHVVKQRRKVVVVDPVTKTETVKYKNVWNYAVADIVLLAFGTSFPQISLATIDSIRNLGSLYSGGLGPGTLLGSAAFDLFPIHAVCVVVPKAGELKKISDIGVWLVELFWSFWAYIWLYIILKVWTPDVITLWEALLTVLQYALLIIHAYAQDRRWPYVSLPFSRSERPLDWVPEETPISNQENVIEDPFDVEGSSCQALLTNEMVEPADLARGKTIGDYALFLLNWKQQFVDVVMFQNNKLDAVFVRGVRTIWNLLLFPWKLMFAFVPPYHVAHGWIAFISSLIFISGIAYIVTMLTESISCVTGINAYVIAFTALAAGTSWPDLVASKIAAARQTTADSAIANITCSNSVNIYIGIGIPWVINTLYNFVTYEEPLRIENATGLSFSLLVFFCTSVGCIAVLVMRRLVFGAELGGPKIWAWVTSVYFMFLWLVFVVLSSLKVSGFF